MPDALYVQALDQVATDIATFTLTDLVHHVPIPVRRFEWKDIRDVAGISVRYTDQRQVLPGPGTNARDIYGYPCHVIVAIAREMDLQPTPKGVYRLRQELVRHFHHRRTMEGLTFGADEDPLPTTVADGPRPPAEYSDRNHHFYTWTIWAWFLEPRDSE